ncbi:uncharacterized protein LOC113203846 [Frankliniella occidentalis]|uniref:Uncharacterized protein LOC113203846 n=1 Tax=Frankliniella occidentalis TaxID=133901 RepID=A0A9C6X6C2_FRAOC|nr:uncharacterized protein LOC113203846 [Frankliniella occidentalis]
MKVLVLVVCLAAAAVADVPREIKEQNTRVHALPHAFETPEHFDDSKGPFHFGELRSLKPIVEEKAYGSDQKITTTVDVKEYKITGPGITTYSAAGPAVSQYNTNQYQQQYNANQYQHQQPASLLIKSVEKQVPAFQQTTFVSQPASSIYYKTAEKVEEPALLTSGVQQVQQIEKVEKIEGAQKVEVPAVTAYSGGYEHSAFIQKQPSLASLSSTSGYGVRSAVSQPTITTYKKEYVSQPAVTTTTTYTSGLPTLCDHIKRKE